MSENKILTNQMQITSFSSMSVLNDLVTDWKMWAKLWTEVKLGENNDNNHQSETAALSAVICVFRLHFCLFRPLVPNEIESHEATQRIVGHCQDDMERILRLESDRRIQAHRQHSALHQ